jgi:hypothetical protein
MGVQAQGTGDGCMEEVTFTLGKDPEVGSPGRRAQPGRTGLLGSTQPVQWHPCDVSSYQAVTGLARGGPS